MKLEWIGKSGLSENDRRMYPNGYWYASTDDGGYDATGPDPLTAVSELSAELEKALHED